MEWWRFLPPQRSHIWAFPGGTQQGSWLRNITLLSFGILTWTPARNPVPRFEGQVRIYPSRSFHMNSQPRAWIKRSTYNSEQMGVLTIHSLGASATLGRDVDCMSAVNEI